MTRIILLCALVAACDVGDATLNRQGADGGGGGSGSDGGGGGSGDGGGSAACANNVTPPPASHTHIASGTTNAGLNCLASGCHSAGGGGNLFSFAGTVYTSAAKTAPKPGATIRVTFSGTTYTAISDDAGNFHQSLAITFPANAAGTSCPSLNSMVGTLVAGGGACNNCHATGGTTSPLYVP